mgnify:CR=1 FL=1
MKAIKLKSSDELVNTSGIQPVQAAQSSSLKKLEKSDLEDSSSLIGELDRGVKLSIQRAGVASAQFGKQVLCGDVRDPDIYTRAQERLVSAVALMKSASDEVSAVEAEMNALLAKLKGKALPGKKEPTTGGKAFAYLLVSGTVLAIIVGLLRLGS